jgi:glycerol-3-phosphate dehydrogenase
MNRESMLDRLSGDDRFWDLLIVGGGATGLGIAVDAASRGYRTALVEQHDFAKATSSRSTKLVHGGVRYLEQGNITLVRDALHERAILARNAPHLVHTLGFVVPAYRRWERPYYGIGLRIYDTLAGRRRLGHSRLLSRDETREMLPTLRSEGLRGGTLYYDAQFDDARLAINLAQTAADHGAVLANYTRVREFIHENGRLQGAVAVDEESGNELRIHATVVINATGVFTDNVRNLDDPSSSPMVQPSQGAHVVLPRSYFPGDTALIVPKTEDGRVLFAIPWHDRVVVGTTDTPLATPELEPRPLAAEVEFILSHCDRYFETPVSRSDVLSVFAGLRPLVKAAPGTRTSALSRDHTIVVSPSGLVTIAGGKWTTYRKMARDTVDRAAQFGEFEPRPCVTEDLYIHGAGTLVESDPIRYGADATAVTAMADSVPEGLERFHPDLPVRPADVVWAARHEMARSIEDVLARRTRCLVLNAMASLEIAEAVSRVLAPELQWSEATRERSVSDFQSLGRRYLL